MHAFKRVYGQPVKASEGVCVKYITWIWKGRFYIGLKQSKSRQKGGKARRSNISNTLPVILGNVQY